MTTTPAQQRRAGLVEEHPEHRSLVRPTGTGEGA